VARHGLQIRKAFSKFPERTAISHLFTLQGPPGQLKRGFWAIIALIVELQEVKICKDDV
jgi:hypothetical protein